MVYPEVSTTYTVLINDGFNPATASTSVTVHPLPVSDAGDDQTIPYGTNTTIYGLAGGGTGPYNYSWEPADSLINPHAQNPATKNLYSNTRFLLKVTDETTGCQSLLDTVFVTLEGGPLGVAPYLQNDTICKGESTTITAQGSGGDFPNYTYTWFYGTTQLKVENGAVSTLEITPTTVGNHTYTVNIDDGYNEFNSSITVHVASTPTFIIQAPPYIVQGGQIVACPADTVILVPNNLFTGADYYWSNGSINPSVKVSTTGIGFNIKTISLKITNPNGCDYTDSITVIFDFAACFGIDEYASFPAVKVFPNPTSGLINVELEKGEGFSAIEIINMQGSLIYRRELDHLVPGTNILNFDLSGSPGGVYLLRAIHDRFIHHQKVILN